MTLVELLKFDLSRSRAFRLSYALLSLVHLKTESKEVLEGRAGVKNVLELLGTSLGDSYLTS